MTKVPITLPGYADSSGRSRGDETQISGGERGKVKGRSLLTSAATFFSWRSFDSIRAGALWPFIAVLLIALISQSSAADQPVKTAGAVRTVELHGRVVCLAEEMHRRHGTELPTKHEHLWALKADDGKCYTILRGKFSEAIFVDERIRAKELVVKARLFSSSQAIEVERLRTMKAGVTQDIFYYCEVCAIESVSPEICACCREPVELIERPLKDSKP
jgi:hypothetical protein